MTRNNTRAAAKKSRLWPFVPLLSFGLLALGLFIALRITRHMACLAIAGGKTGVACTFSLPPLVGSLPLAFVAVGFVITGIRLIMSR